MKLIPKEKLIKIPIDNHLYSILFSLCEDEHFIIGIFAILKTYEQKKKFIQEIEENLRNDYLKDDEDAVDIDTIILLAVDIADGIEF